MQIARLKQATIDRIDLFDRSIDRGTLSLARGNERIMGALEDLLKLNRLMNLDSVGAMISHDSSLVRHQMADGSIEMDDDQATHLDDVSDEWMNALSDEDSATVMRIKEVNR